MTRWPRFVFALVAALLAAAQHADAQDGRTGVSGRSIGDTIVFTAESRSYQVVRIPIPPRMRGADGGSVDIEVEPSFMMIGARRTVLTGRAALEDVLVTFGIPKNAHAGAHRVARAIFRTADSAIEVPIEARVKPAYKIALTVASEIADIQLGDRLELQVRVANLGNTSDTIRVGVETPEPWHSAIRDSSLVVAPGDTAIRRVRLVVPKHSGTGSFFVRTHATSHGSSASRVTTLSVGNASPHSAPPGPIARIGLGTVGVQDGGSAMVGQLAIAGPLTRGIYVHGRASTEPPIDAAGIRGLARVGTYVTTPHLTAWSSTWRFKAGSAVADFGDVMGVNAGGHGVSFDFDNDRTRYEVFAARPVARGVGDTGGSILGGQYASRFGFATVGGAISRIRSAGLYAQTLSAYGLNLSATASESLRLNGTVAYRDFETGTGVGWAAKFNHRQAGNHAELRVVHAPGGSAAFARAVDELSASVTRAISSRYDISASYFRSSDANAAASDVRSSAIRLSQQYRVSQRVLVRAEAQVSDFDVTGEPFSFSNGEKRIGAGATASFGKMTASTDLGFGRLSRGINASDVDAVDTGNRIVWRSTLARALTFGALQLETSYEHNDRGTGYVPEQMVMTLKADRARLPFGPRNLSVDAEIGHERWSGIRSFTNYRAGANYLLPAGTEISAALERNPLLYTATGKAPIILALRVDKAIGLPRLMTGRAAGVVFHDYNGNGRRDDGEPGMANIMVRRGNTSAVTGRDGSYRFWESGRGQATPDPATLPDGWIINDKSASQDIALTPTTTVEVVLQPGAAERLRNIDLTNVVVMARDELGRSWIARRTSAETAIFEALPVGSYELDLDFTALGEPLRIDGPTPRLTVTRETTAPIVVPISGRPLRFNLKQQESR